MEGLVTRLAGRPFHPLLAALTPLSILLAHNVVQVRLTEGLRPLVISLGVVTLLLVVLRRVTRDAHRAALLTTSAILLILSYGHLYIALKVPLGASLVRHRYLFPMVLAIWLVVMAGLIRLRSPSFATPFVNILTVAAIAPALFQLVAPKVASLAPRAGQPSPQATCGLTPLPGEPRRDVYLIVMDAYERDDVLREMHGYDNSPFLEALTSMGFYVAYGSMSNYRHTEMSLPSVLNMDYIQSFPESYDPETEAREGVIRLIADNRLRRELECLGYLTVSFETGAQWTEWHDADYFLERTFGQARFLARASRFEVLWLDTTLARLVLDGIRVSSWPFAIPEVLDSFAEHRELVLFSFDQLTQVARLPSPKLVFVHIISPHPPMVFGPSGEPTSLLEFEARADAVADQRAVLRAYADQVAYLNIRLLEAFSAILQESEVEPIIVLMGDHGWADRNHEDKLSILNAYFLPMGGDEGLYPTITPVNSFRVVLDRYFQADLGLLEDVSYFSLEGTPFRFEVVPNTWSPGS